MWYYILGTVVAVWLTSGVYRYLRRRGKRVYIVETRCTGCGRCVRICRHKVLEIVKDGETRRVLVRRPENCSACGNCMAGCTAKAMEIRRID
jgi:NAD-dependent dihydropyrimidine dehydrogenase PreA subunit